MDDEVTMIDCPKCGGYGEFPSYSYSQYWSSCSECDGTGEIEDDTN